MAESAALPSRGSRMRSAVLAVVFAALFAALYALAILTPAGQHWDAASLGTFWWLRGEEWLAVYEIRDWLPLALLALAVVAALESVFRWRWSAVVSAGALVALTGLGSYAFKQGVLPRPYLGEFAYTYQTFPSGHTAITLAATVAIVWFAPRWLRPFVVVILGVVVVIVGLTSLLSYAHRVSDVIGGVLLVGALAFAITSVAGQGRSHHARARTGWTTAGALSATAGIIVLAGAVAAGVVDLAALGIATVLLLCGATTLVLAAQREVPG